MLVLPAMKPTVLGRKLCLHWPTQTHTPKFKTVQNQAVVAAAEQHCVLLASWVGRHAASDTCTSHVHIMYATLAVPPMLYMC